MKTVVGFVVKKINNPEPWLLELSYEYKNARWLDTPRTFKDLMSLTAYIIQFPHGNGGTEHKEDQCML
jgi:hypothetical protein